MLCEYRKKVQDKILKFISGEWRECRKFCSIVSIIRVGEGGSFRQIPLDLLNKHICGWKIEETFGGCLNIHCVNSTKTLDFHQTS